jgi:tetratricopeptide (TPR) repeat protein
MQRPLCYVLMPFGTKVSGARSIDFDTVYRDLVAPALNDAGLESLRADAAEAEGTLAGPHLEGLVLSDCAIVDVTTAGPGVFYALGARHALRPASTLVLFANNIARPPADIAAMHAVSYESSANGGVKDVHAARSRLSGILREALGKPDESALYQLVDGNSGGDIARLKTDVFRDKVEYSASAKDTLEQARKQGVDAVRAAQRGFGDLREAPAGVVIDLFLSYRAVKAWEDMIALVKEMAPPLAASTLVQEQLAFALNRAGRGEEAEQVLRDLLASRGDSSETCALLGRVYKDRWDAASKKGDRAAAKELLQKAVDAYLRGFEADWRDAFPGVNTVTLMELQEPPNAKQQQLIPVVRYAVERRIATAQPDYWDHATLVELAILARDEAAARAALKDALACVREAWEPESTARNLRLIREARARRGETLAWARTVEDALAQRAHGGS